MCHWFLYGCLGVSKIEVQYVARFIMLVAVYRKPPVTVSLAPEPGWENEFFRKPPLTCLFRLKSHGQSHGLIYSYLTLPK
jgi:hypothetical protein